MKLLMVMQHVNFFRNLETIVRELHARGHEVVVLHATREKSLARQEAKRKAKRQPYLGRSLQVTQAEIPGVTVGFRPEPIEPWHLKLAVGRLVINRGIYYRKGHPAPDRVADAIEQQLPPALQKRVQSRVAQLGLGRSMTLRAWRWIEAATPASPTIVSALRAIAPDVLLVAPSVWPKPLLVEADYIRAGRALGIPTIGYVNSWDNLTCKGTLHVIPDALVVWNEPMAREAVEIHDIPRRAIRVTGAPHIDRFFEMRPSLSRAELCAQMGCPDSRPYVLYFCTSAGMVPQEVAFVGIVADALAREFPEGPPTLVVRPHPTLPLPWAEYRRPGVVVYPTYGDLADHEEAWQDYYNQIAHAACVVGVNTTAFLESAVVNRPCLTVVADEFHGAQGKTGHFRHLIDGDFLEVSSTVSELAARVRRILGGADEKAAGRRAFTQSFIRPCGLDRPPTRIVADLIESMAPR